MSLYKPWCSLGSSTYECEHLNQISALAALTGLPSEFRNQNRKTVIALEQYLRDNTEPPVVVVDFKESSSTKLEPDPGFSEFEMAAAATHSSFMNSPKSLPITYMPKHQTMMPPHVPTVGQGLLLLQSVVGQLIHWVWTYTGMGDIDAWLLGEGFGFHTDIVVNVNSLRTLLLRLAKRLQNDRMVYIFIETDSLNPHDADLRGAIHAILSLPQELGKGCATFKVLANLPDYEKDDVIFAGIKYQDKRNKTWLEGGK